MAPENSEPKIDPAKGLRGAKARLEALGVLSRSSLAVAIAVLTGIDFERAAWRGPQFSIPSAHFATPASR